MKAIASAGIFLALGTGHAVAADMLAAPAPVAPPAAEVWLSPFAGFYAGAFAGHAWSDTDVNADRIEGAIFVIDVNNGTLASEDEYSPLGFLGGVQAGYDFAFDALVVGVVGDFAWADLEETHDYIAEDLYLFPGSLTYTTFETEIDWLATARVRAGATYSSTLFYATGGLAFGDVHNGLSVAIPDVGYAPAPWTQSGVRTGWVVGAGIEHAVSDRFSIELEYLHFDLGEETIRAADNATFPGQFIDYSFDNSGDIVRVGANFRL